MKDRVQMDIGMKGQLKEWSDIEWKTVKKKVRNLRQRIYRATQRKQWNKVRSLMKLMLRSYSNLLMSVRKVTQENQGRQTPGIDGIRAITPKERVKLTIEMRENKLWQTQPVKRIYIPKANGKKRPLGIPTIKNRVAQAIVKNALEPSWEARFEANSFGFRPGRSCQDAIEQCWLRLSKGRDEWILDADIKGAFDNISHEFILTKLGEVPGRELIKQWLKAGYVEAEIFHQTEKGTPQGGIISPLLANVALDGMEQFLGKYQKTITYEGTDRGKSRKRKVTKPKFGYIRYADDFIVTAKEKEDIEEIMPEIQKWLAQRGLELNLEKTKVKHITEGFNYLGFNIRSYPDGKCLTKPEKDKVIAKLREIKEWLNNNKMAKTENIINHLNPILRGWANYYQYGVSGKVFSYVNHHIVKMLTHWAKFRHPNKGKKWVISRYFKRLGNDHWVFFSKTKDRRGKEKYIHIYNVSHTPITRYVKVKETASPDDPDLLEYWNKRNTNKGKNYFGKGTKLLQVAKNQNWKCPVCGEHLLNGELLETHHLIKIKTGGTDEIENLTHVHKACHKHIHSGKQEA